MEMGLCEQKERVLLQQFEDAVRRIDSQAHGHVRELQEDLGRLSGVFSRCPSIIDRRSFGEEVQSADTLVELLFRDGCDHIVLLPTKVVVGRSCLVAKFNLFGYLIKLCEYYPRLAHFKDELQKSWEYAIFSVLIEEVYQVIIERSSRYSERVRRVAALDLIHLWEYRFDLNVADYATIIVDLWRVRKRVAPVFGTMLGTRELMSISSLLPDRWHQFLLDHGDDQEVVQAVEEFIFGLTYEDITTVRHDMRRRGVTVIDRDEIANILGNEHRYDEISSFDPREMYRFYQTRQQQLARRRVAGLPGPQRTLEELLLAHLLEEKLVANQVGQGSERAWR